MTSGEFPSSQFFEQVYAGDAPWDIGEPQPDLIRLIGEFPAEGRMLDLGCGTGDLAIGLAQTGYSVVGIDFAPSAIAIAKERVTRLSPHVQARTEFRVGDAFEISRWTGEFGAITDSGLYHLFGTPERRGLAHEIRETLPVGGRFYLLGFATSIEAPNVPREVTREEIAELFSEDAGWLVRSVRQARFHTRGFGDIPALALCAERSA